MAASKGRELTRTVSKVRVDRASAQNEDRSAHAGTGGWRQPGLRCLRV